MCSAAQKHWETEIYICFAGRITASVFIISSSENGKYVHRSMAAEREVEPFNPGKKRQQKCMPSKAVRDAEDWSGTDTNPISLSEAAGGCMG